MSYALYKLMHFFGIFTLVLAIAARALHILRGGTRTDDPYRRQIAAAHGVAFLLILTGGFGMLARLGVMHTGLPGWVYAKLVVWLLFGAALTIASRNKSGARAILIAIPFLGITAAAIALYKPFQ